MAASQFDAQHAVRMDAEQLNDYMQELFNWSKDMKRNERAKPPPPPQAAPAASKQQASGPTADQLQQQQAVPPPPPQQQQEEGGSVARHPAAHTYEHYSRKWDRFDVDAALAEDDAEGGTSTQQASTQPAQQPSSSSAAPSSSGRSAPVAIPQARATVPVGPSKASAPAVAPTSVGAAPTSAEGWKDAGNAAFKRGQHREAADCYTRSLELQPTCLAFANRAMARLKLGQAAEAEADCSQALDLDPLYTKAYLRRWVGVFRLLPAGATAGAVVHGCCDGKWMGACRQDR
jgi:Meckel syndrome type 1 protein